MTPGPDTIQYPVLLPDLPRPQLRAYPKYTVIAEKFHAICLLGMANSRMKDFFDLHVLLGEEDLDPAEIQRAVAATFARRKTDLPSAIPVGLSDGFASDAMKQTQWRAFLRKNRLPELALVAVVNKLRSALLRVGTIRADHDP